MTKALMLQSSEICVCWAFSVREAQKVGGTNLRRESDIPPRTGSQQSEGKQKIRAVTSPYLYNS
jgi:hypothetical protein